MSAQFDSDRRDAYWEATQAELKSTQKRGDLVTVIALALVLTVLWLNFTPGENTLWWTIGCVAVALLCIGAPLWFVTQRKRRISAARGLICGHCHYVPHDTEITEVVATRACQRCNRPLD
jgi:hypothetical protein